ncbi:MAG: CRISPR-associated protein Cas4 [Methylobacter sp.]|nr:CRISPR-associated protein Cas4 [Methylobacter sp.]MDP2097143.1 CRISPR-associated protein Cas4 [Methylobacter sp.]MDP2426949.1 CRISPR-associated protein Cas4 [Methylobacter sp.]MDP3056715.1 CRISPR-associated protein Cas4 [Methylobacter sp.]MDP3361265.1 CRISPR-associated protein Cas4 [Methylobacter sp.]
MQTFEPIFLSRLQHYLFCPRQFALIELEDIWTENQWTAEGQVLHQKVNQPDHEKRGSIRTAWALRLANAELGIEGVADVVEYHKQADGTEIPYPIEYKRGKPKTHRADEVQLCAQALCLEDMHGVAVPEGALFYGEVRRRHPVIFDAELRDLTAQTILACRTIVQTKATPKAVYKAKKCKACSLIDPCHPKGFHKSAAAWLAAQLTED